MKGQSFFETRAFQIDLGRQPESVDTLKKIFEQGRRFHFNQCHLYLENKLQLDSFGDAAAGLSGEDVGEIVSCGDQLGLEIVPSLNLLGHTEHFTKYPEFKRLSETRDGARKPDQDYAGCLCPSLPETRQWARSVIEEVAEIFPSPNLHVGLDETWSIGSCPLCAKREDRGELGALFSEYANCLHEKAVECGKTMWMWADMLFYFPGAMEELNKDIVLVDWFYGDLDPIPRQTFFNWRRVDTTAKLLQEGFRVVPAGGLGLNNVRGFTRYVDGLDTDTFLVTQWEGSNRFQLDYAPERCAAGILLSSNHMPQMNEMGRYLLPDGSADERQKFMTAISASGRSLEVAPEMLAELGQTPLVKACRSRVLQKYVGQESGKIMRELKLIARDMLRENRHSSFALERELEVLDRVLDRVKEWEELLAELQREYQESEDDRRIYGQARKQGEKLAKVREGVQRFVSSPTDENYPFSAAELVLEFLVIDPCAHGCAVEVSADGQSFRSIYQTHRLSHRGYGPASLSLEVREMPRFVRIAISGYARLGLVNVWGETVQGRYLPCSIEAAEGCIVDAEHLLEWDQKSAFLNDPDVEEKWRIRGDLPEHWVTLKFDSEENCKDPVVCYRELKRG